MTISANGISMHYTLDGPAAAPVVTLSHSLATNPVDVGAGAGRAGSVRQAHALRSTSRIPAEAKSAWDERITTATTKGMDPLVEPTIGRWFTPPFIAARGESSRASAP